MFHRLRALLITDPLIILATIVMGSLSLATSVFDARGRAQHAVARAWARMLLRIAGIRLTVQGLEKLNPEGSYVIAANHESYYDIPVLLAALPLQIRFFAKQGLFYIPFLGWHLKRAGHIAVPREDVKASLKSMTAGAQLIAARGVCVLIFPEGGRSPKGIREFKEGAAYVAIKAGVPVVPVGLRGTRRILPMDSLLVGGGPVEVRVGDPIPVAGTKLHARGRLNQRLYEQVCELAGFKPEFKSR